MKPAPARMASSNRRRSRRSPRPRRRSQGPPTTKAALVVSLKELIDGYRTRISHDHQKLPRAETGVCPPIGGDHQDADAGGCGAIGGHDHRRRRRRCGAAMNGRPILHLPAKRRPPDPEHGSADAWSEAVGAGTQERSNTVKVALGRRPHQGIAPARCAAQPAPIWTPAPGEAAAAMLLRCWTLRRRS